MKYQHLLFMKSALNTKKELNYFFNLTFDDNFMHMTASKITQLLNAKNTQKNSIYIYDNVIKYVFFES